MVFKALPLNATFLCLISLGQYSQDVFAQEESNDQESQAAPQNPLDILDNLKPLTVENANGFQFALKRINSDGTQHSSWKPYYELSRKLEVLEEGTVASVKSTLASNEWNRSVLLVGDSIELFKYIVARISLGNIENWKKGSWFFELNTVSLESGRNFTGELEGFWQDNIVKPLSYRPAVLVVSNLAPLIGTGTHSNQKTGIESDFATKISEGSLISIAYLDRAQYAAIQNSEHAYVLNSFAATYQIPVLNSEALKSVLKGKLQVSKKDDLITDADLDFLIKESAKYLPRRPEPDRSLTVLNHLLSTNKSTAEKTTTLNRENIRESLGKVAQIPQWLLKRDWTTLKALKNKLAAKLVGQPTAQAQIVELAKIGYTVGHTHPRPIGTALFAGSTGTGKTYLAQKFAQYLELPLTTFDMTQYTNAQSQSKFVDTLATALTKNPYGVFVFDEIDKADVAVLDKLFFLMDEGVFYDSEQKPLFGGGAFVILTTNVGEKSFLAAGDDPHLNDLVLNELRRVFRESFLNRLDLVSAFKPFSPSEFQKLGKIMVQEKVDELKIQKNWIITVDEGTQNFISEKGQSKRYGARPMKRLISNVIDFGLAEFQLTFEPLPLSETQISISLVDNIQGLFEIKVGDKTHRYNVTTNVNTGD